MSAKDKPRDKQRRKPAGASMMEVSRERDEIPNTSVVYELDLSRRKLDEIKGLNKFSKLRILDLSCNSITRLEGLSSNTELKELKAHGNRIEGELKGVEMLVQLVHLMLQFNKLTSLGSGLNRLCKLQLLRVDNNLLREITPEMLKGLKELVHLDASHNQLVQFKCGYTLPMATHLNLSYNQLSTFPDDIINCQKLEELDISGNPIKSMKPLKSLKVLYAQEMSWTSVCVLCPAQTLQQLHVSKNKWSTLEGLSGLFPSLTVLDVRWNRIGTMEGLEELKKMTKLQELYLEGNPLVYDRSNVRALAPTLSVVDEDNSLERLRPTTPTPTPMIATPLQPSLSYKKVEQEILQKEQTFQSLHDDIHSKFTSLFSELEQLDERGSVARPRSQASSRVRLDHAKQFANQMPT